jgi:hypothetical protein
VPGEAVDEVVLAAVGLVGDDDDVAALGQRCRGQTFAPSLSTTITEDRSYIEKEFLDRCEDHAAVLPDLAWSRRCGELPFAS